MSDVVIEAREVPPAEVKAEVEPAPVLVDAVVQEVQFFEDHVRAILSGGVEKLLSHDEFRAILNKTLGVTESQKLDGFNLPSNVFYFAKSSSEIQISCYYQSRVAEIRYHNKKMKIVLPNIIISHILNANGKQEWQMQSSKYFCTQKTVSQLPRTFIDKVDHGAGIYLQPMSNTYDEGRMCYGQNQMVNRFVENNLRGLDWYYQYMFESPFNDDLGIRAVAETNPKAWYSELEQLAKQDKPFPYNRLRGYRAA
jgi:hypothetical protein